MSRDVGILKLATYLGLVTLVCPHAGPVRAESRGPWPLTAVLHAERLYSLRYDAKKTVELQSLAHLARIPMSDPTNKAPISLGIPAVGAVTDEHNLIR